MLAAEESAPLRYNHTISNAERTLILQTAEEFTLHQRDWMKRPVKPWPSTWWMATGLK